MLRYTPKLARPLFATFAVPLDQYAARRIDRNLDWLKQPSLDFLRWVSHALYRLLRRFHRPRTFPSHPSRFLLIRRNRLGDAINTLPLACALKLAYPGATIEVLANPYNAAVFRWSSGVDRIWVLPERHWGNRWLVRWHPTMRALRRRHYDVVLNASGAYSSQAATLAGWVPAAWRIGVASPKGSIHDLNYDGTIRLDRATLESHQVQRLAAVARQGGLSIGNLPWVLFDRLRADIPAAIPDGQAAIAFCPEVARNESAWPVAHYRELIAALRLRYPLRALCLVIDGPDSIYADLADAAGVTLTPRRSLEDFTSFLSVCALVVCSEGGVSHLAPAAGVATIALSGKNVASTWLPWSPLALLLEVPGDVARITPRQVVHQIAAYLDNGHWLPDTDAHSFGLTSP
ncbi:MAG: glycosyltransferase family 9 protein [Rhodocyclaceae bacterium]|nr:glycosyltransferase family 9 protein [Rhodocyclaceae bacterium]